MRKLADFFERVLTYSADISVLMIMCLTTADATGRYIFNFPVAGAYEVTEKYLMVMVVFLGICYAYRKGNLIRVTFFIDRIPQRVKIFINYLVQILSTIYFISLIFATIRRALHTIASGTNVGVLALPLWPAYVIIPICLFFLSVFMIFDIPLIKKGKSPLFREESPIDQPRMQKNSKD